VVSSNVLEYSKLLDVGAAMRFPIVLDARETDAVELENAQEAMSVPNAKRDNSCPSESVNLLGTDENNRTGNWRVLLFSARLLAEFYFPCLGLD
jgi:hypothetical protein